MIKALGILKIHSYTTWQKLNLYASKNYRVLLTTIRDSTNASERRKAAALLAWSEHPNETLEFILQWGLLK